MRNRCPLVARIYVWIAFVMAILLPQIALAVLGDDDCYVIGASGNCVSKAVALDKLGFPCYQKQYEEDCTSSGSLCTWITSSVEGLSRCAPTASINAGSLDPGIFCYSYGGSASECLGAPVIKFNGQEPGCIWKGGGACGVREGSSGSTPPTTCAPPGSVPDTGQGCSIPKPNAGSCINSAGNTEYFCTPEMSDMLALAFVAVAGGLVFWLRRRGKFVSL